MSSMMGEFSMSSLVDNIILLNLIELGLISRAPERRPPPEPPEEKE